MREAGKPVTVRSDVMRNPYPLLNWALTSNMESTCLKGMRCCTEVLTGEPGEGGPRGVLDEISQL